MKKIIGRNYLHAHPMDEAKLGMDKEHCIVDQKELEEVQKFFKDNPNLVEWIGKGNIHWDKNIGIPFRAMKYTIEIGKAFDLEKNIEIPKQTMIITEEQKAIIEHFADIERDEELNTFYILNKCKFKIGIYFEKPKT